MRSKLAARTVLAQRLGYNVTEAGDPRCPAGKEIKTSVSNKGYLKFSVPRRPGDRDRTVFVHQLVALQWFGKRALEEGTQVRHLNGCRTDNRKTNISIGTPSENQLDIPPDLRRRRVRKGVRVAAERSRRFSAEEFPQGGNGVGPGAWGSEIDHLLHN